MGQRHSNIYPTPIAKRNEIYYIKNENQLLIQKKFTECELFRNEKSIIHQCKNKLNHVIINDLHCGMNTIIYPYDENFIDLLDMVNTYQINNLTKWNMFEKIVYNVMQIHSIGIEHHDLKLENILFTKDKKCCRIIDFEMASDGFKVSKYIKFGTMSYLPPESIFSTMKKQFGKKDVWALGIMFIHLFYSDYPIKENLYIEYTNLMKEKKKYPFFIQECLEMESHSRISSKDLYHFIRNRST